MTDKLLSRYKQKIQSMQLIPAGGGCFELTIDGELLYSKLMTGEFPDEPTMIEHVGDRIRSR